MNCIKLAQERRVQLSPYQQALIKPALACVQFGASFYFAEHLKPYLLPVLMVSLATIAIIALQVLKGRSGG